MAAPRLYSGYIKNKSHGSESISVTIINIWLKSYLSFFKWVADRMRGCNGLAIALNKLYPILTKKINKKIYCFFSTLMTNSSSSANIVQQILSFSDRFSALTTSVGIVVLKDFEWDACKFAVDSTSNNFIPPFMYFLVNIFVNILYISYLPITYK